MFEQRVESHEIGVWTARGREFHAEGTDKANTHLTCSSNVDAVWLE